jgi:hypothetical protein
MKNKTIFSCLIILLTWHLPLAAQKKPLQAPLKELSDPSSHNYVPYPYPKTDFEIIEDFKYGIKTLWGHKKKFYKSIRKSDEVAELKLQLLSLLDEKPTLEIKRIIKVEDMGRDITLFVFFSSPYRG